MRFRWVCVCALMLGMSFLFAMGEDELPPGKMQAKVKATCTQCHAVSNITKKPRTRAEWSKVLDKMTGYGADVDDKDRDAILDYLSTNFGPGKTTSSKHSKPGSSEQ